MQNSPQYVESIRTARDAAGAAKSAAGEVDLMDDTLRGRGLAQPARFRSMVEDRSPEGTQRLAETVRGWNDRLKHGQEQLGQVKDHLDAAAGAIDAAREHRQAAETPGMLPRNALPEYGLEQMSTDVQNAQREAAALGAKLGADSTDLENFVLDKADTPPVDWDRDIEAAAASISWSSSRGANLAASVDKISSGLDTLSSKLDEHAPEAGKSDEAALSAGSSSEQDLRHRTSGKAGGGRVDRQPPGK